jgi:hypothetical protein
MTCLPAARDLQEAIMVNDLTAFHAARRGRAGRHGQRAALVLLLLLALASPVAAHDTVGAGAAPTEGTPDGAGGELPLGDEWLGDSLMEEHAECTPARSAAGGWEDRRQPVAARAGPSAPDCPEHWSWSIHWHVVGRFLRAYDGYTDRWLTGTYAGPQTATYGRNTSYGNAWGASISFDPGPVSSAVSYNVTWSTTEWWTSSFDVPSGQKFRLNQRTWYHVRVYNAWTETCLDPICKDVHTAFGTAWGGRTFDRVYKWLRVG